jgi:hypothetical protein
MAVIAPRDVTVRSIELIDSPKKIGAPVITGLTVEAADGEQTRQGVRLPHTSLSPEVVAFVKDKALRAADDVDPDQAKKTHALIRALYVTPEDFAVKITPDMPENYRGPVVSFKGNAYADVLTGIFHYNVNDIDSKVTSDGMYHTSTKNAPSWGGYQGFGNYVDGFNSYFGHSWSRDLGRSLQEITALGLLDKSRICADYCLRMTRLWIDRADQPDMKYHGNALPPHVSRIMNLPNTRPNEGCFENDGHGLVSLFIYNLWRRIPDRDEWLKTRWEDVKDLGDWVVWQFDHPEISGAKETLRTDSECAGGTGYSVYADMACMEALRGLADMAESIGKTDEADLWRKTADRLQKGCTSSYVVDEKDYGKAWTLACSGWPNRSTVLGPIMLLTDRRGFDRSDDDPAWVKYNEATYKRLIDTYKPFGYYGVAMGYGQGFVTESALLLDRMKDATTMLEWAAKCTYDPKFESFIVPEGCELEPGGRFWHRTGDLGNGVQEGEIVKALRIVIGVDDCQPSRLRVMPRMPYGWSEMTVDKLPALVQTADGPQLAAFGYTLRRDGRKMTLEMTSDKSLGAVAFRLGPFKKDPGTPSASVNGEKAVGTKEFSGDSWWIRINAASVGTHVVVSAK